MSSQKELLALEDRYPVRREGFRGKFVVISNETFLSQTLKRRLGTAKDVERLTETFSGLGFEFTNNVYKDKTASQMHKIMIEVSNAGLEKYDCLAIAILTHGGPDDRIHGVGPADDLISLDKLFEPLKHGMRLKGKPVLIFIQACRGENLNSGKLVQTDTPKRDNGSDSPSFIKIPVEADFLYHFSTSPGYYSFRNAKGSIFIQSLCKVMAKYTEKNEEIDLMKVLTRVNREVSEGYSSYVPSDEAFHDMKQMPSILSMLRKDVYLHPSGGSQVFGLGRLKIALGY